MTNERVSAKPAKQGTYRAFDQQGNVLWEQPKFVVGVDRVPAGVAVVMRAMTITGAGGKVVSQWNPWGVLS